MLAPLVAEPPGMPMDGVAPGALAGRCSPVSYGCSGRVLPGMPGQTGIPQTRPATAAASGGWGRARGSEGEGRGRLTGKSAGAWSCQHAASKAPSSSPNGGTGRGKDHAGQRDAAPGSGRPLWSSYRWIHRSAAPHAITLVAATRAARCVREMPQRLSGDRAYDSDTLDVAWRRRGVEMRAPPQQKRRKPRMAAPGAATSGAGRRSAASPGLTTSVAGSCVTGGRLPPSLAASISVVFSSCFARIYEMGSSQIHLRAARNDEVVTQKIARSMPGLTEERFYPGGNRNAARRDNIVSRGNTMPVGSFVLLPPRYQGGMAQIVRVLIGCFEEECK